MVIKILYIAIGGSLGSILRFLFSHFCKIYVAFFPAGTLLVNVLGSFFIGFFASYLNNKEVSEIIVRYFLIIGLLGSFTTFSAFSIETLELYKQDGLSLSLLYVILSVILSIFAAYIGFTLFKY